jgi:hypothetical protein
MKKEEDLIVATAPWVLMGRGYIILIKLSPKFVIDKGFVPETLSGFFTGGLGTIMYMDYIFSDVGPYKELLFIPGKFSFDGINRFSITKIYVSTMASVINGQNNWGIPKELADFEVINDGSIDRIRISKDNRLCAELCFRSYPFSIPVTTSIVPSRLHTLVQLHGGKKYITTPEARGAISFARLTGATIDESLFPDFTQGRIFCAAMVPRFLMVFPKATIL